MLYAHTHKERLACLCWQYMRRTVQPASQACVVPKTKPDRASPTHLASWLILEALTQHPAQAPGAPQQPQQLAEAPQPPPPSAPPLEPALQSRAWHLALLAAPLLPPLPPCRRRQLRLLSPSSASWQAWLPPLQPHHSCRQPLAAASASSALRAWLPAATQAGTQS